MKHLKLFFALFAMLALGVGNAWGETVTYQHVFNKKPSTGNSVALSSVNWKIEATALNNYNSNNYAGVQIGSSKAAGSITLTSTTDWDYNGNGKITEVRLWLNTGGSAVTPTITIGGKSATSDGTKVVKNSKAGTDWTKATKVTFTPVADGNTGVVVINVSTEKAGYICAMEIDCEPATADGDDEGGNVEIVESPTFSETEVNFTEAFDLTIASAEGTTLKYTLDNSDPTTSNTAVVVESNIATVAVSGKSTVVKAVAVKGELVSGVKSITYCYVNSKETAYTITEALEVYNAGLGLDNSLYIQGTVKSITEMNTTQFYNANYTITDGENDLYIFRGKGIDGANFTSESQLLVGDDLVIYGKLSEYQGIPQVAQDSKIISRESKTKAIIAEDLTFDAIAIGAEVEAQTLTVTGANLTAEIAATLDNEKFTVTPATLSVDGGELTITPATDLEVGEHTATLTLTSGETTKEVALSILVKNVYTITWSVNGETTTTSVVEGDKLVLPAAPETPEACSEKVFVGWTAAEEVNADGSDIEWVTAATLPTAAATYYAVFAAQEGEGGLSEVVDVLDRALTGVEGTNYASWADVSATSDAVYAGQSAGGNEAIQLRSNNSNSGVISTTSGGKLAKVTVKWNSNTASGRTLSVYGSNTAYTSPTELYGEASGEKLGTIVNGTSTELVIEGDYVYVGLRSNSGAMYLDEIQITWLAGAAATYTNYSTTCVAPVVNHTIIATAGEGGTVTGLENDGVYAEGTELTLTATPADHYVFVNWTKGEEVVSTENPYTFNVTADIALVANFAKKTYTVTATAENGSVEGLAADGKYEHGAEATLTATPAEGYEFVKWTENEVEVSTDAEYTFEVLADRNLVANFKKKTYTVTATAENGTVTGAGTYEHGKEVTLTATAAEGYEFVNWTSGETVVSTENPYKFTVTADVDLVANFKEKEVAPTKLYLTPNANWKQSNARFAAYFFGNGETWVSMTKVAGETDLYEVTIPTDKKYPKVIFCRMNPSASANNWNNRWNQTDDLVIPTDVQNHYTVKAGTWDKGGGTWSIWPVPVVKTYKDITITVIANATPKIHYWEGGDKMVGSSWENKPEMVATGEENTYSYTIKDVDEATGVKYLVVVGDIQSADQITSVNVTKNFKEILPQVAVQGVNNWDGTDKMTVSDDYLTAAITLSLEANKQYDLKLTVNGDWFGGNTIAITKDKNSAIFDTNGEGDGKITTDLAGGYVFTYTYATKILTVAYPVSVTATAENGTVEGAGTYTHGTEVTLIATPAEGYEFVNWTAGKDTVSTEATYTFTVEADVNLVANFQEVVPVITHTVTFEYSIDAGYITVNDNHISEKEVKYAEGTVLTVKALTFDNYRFDAWEDEDGNELSTEPTYTFTVTKDVVLKAIITPEQGAVGTSVENNNVVMSETIKVIQNGRLFIIREGKIYNAQGQVVK